jgi:hypothetical protein
LNKPDFGDSEIGAGLEKPKLLIAEIEQLLREPKPILTGP